LENIKLIATDIDHTLFDSNHNYDVERFNRYLSILHQKNIKFAVASGNNYHHIKNVFRDSPDIDAIISENGAQITVGTNVIYAKIFTKDTLRKMSKLLVANLNLESLAFSGEKGTYIDEIYQQVEGYYIDKYINIKDIDEIDDKIFKMNIKLAHPELRPAMKFINANYSDIVHAAVSGFGSIDITLTNTNKGIAVTHLCDFYNISPSNLMTFGDNSNDLEMIETAGIGIAMKNGIDDVKQVSNLITKDDNDHDGVLNTLSEILSI